MTTLTAKITPVLKRLNSTATLDPTRDWLMMLIASAIILAGVVIWNAWIFDTVATGGSLGGSSAAAPKTPAQTSLDTIRATFSTRASEKEKYLTGVYQFADPSQ